MKQFSGKPTNMKINHIITLFLLLPALLCACDSPKEKELKVLQLNVWYQGQKIGKGIEGIRDIIDQTDADIVLLCELKRDPEKNLMPWLISELEARGKYYKGDNLKMNVGILSKYDIIDSSDFFPTEEFGRPMVKASLRVYDQVYTIYSVHLDHTHYECYMPRGYSGTSWQKLDAPVNNADSVLAANRISLRDESIVSFLEDARKEIDKGHVVIMGGDFNEPSHLDWQADTKDMRNHNGLVINWDCSVMLHNAGFIDTYRKVHPNAVTHPGFSFPAGNKQAELSDLAWCPDVDERDRIDFIYYHPHPSLSLKKAKVVGPSASIFFGQIVEEDSEDPFIIPNGVWPTDHKGMLTTFTINVR